MKTLVLALTTIMLGSLYVLPATAETVSNEPQNAVIEQADSKAPVTRWFHAKRKLALVHQIGASQEDANDDGTKGLTPLDYATDNYIINGGL